MRLACAEQEGDALVGGHMSDIDVRATSRCSRRASCSPRGQATPNLFWARVTSYARQSNKAQTYVKAHGWAPPRWCARYGVRAANITLFDEEQDAMATYDQCDESPDCLAAEVTTSFEGMTTVFRRHHRRRRRRRRRRGRRRLCAAAARGARTGGPALRTWHPLPGEELELSDLWRAVCAVLRMGFQHVRST